MGRKRRSYLPGAVFHLTARTQGGEPWFTPVLRSRVVQYTASAIRRSDATLIAYAVMPNHLHVVLRQGRQPLEKVMQPLLRRTALVVQRSHGVSGHVFERRFDDRPCPDPEYIRNAIVYTHLNPIRAGLAGKSGAYTWTSQAFYLGDIVPEPLASVLAVDDGLGLFAPRAGATLGELRRAHADFLSWRLECDRQHAANRKDGKAAALPVRPPVAAGDLHWTRSFAPFSRGGPAGQVHRFRGNGAPAGDLERIARQTLTEHAPELHLDEVRTNSKRPAVVRVRRRLIRRMDAAGHRGSAIARYLGVSHQCVSNVLRSEELA